MRALRFAALAASSLCSMAIEGGAPAGGDPDRAKQTSLSACNKIITNIARSATKLNETIHNAALLVAEHARNYGDTTPCASLVDAMPMSHRRSLLINWFDAFTPVGVAKDGKTGKMKAHLKGRADEREAMWKLAAGKATPFYAMPDVEREPDVPTYDTVHDNIVAFVKRIENKAKEIPNEDDQRRALAEVDRLKAAAVRAA